MKIVLIIISSVLIISACSKDNASCVAKDANGDPLYETVGKDLCEDQIDTANGEYCDCTD